MLSEIAQPDTFLTLARVIVDGQQQIRDAHRTGVSWSGLQPDPPAVEDVEEVAARLRQGAEDLKRWLASPRGRFYAAIEELQNVGFLDEALRLRGEYNRSLADDREPLNVRAVGACLAILNPMRSAYARAAVDALAELLILDAGDRRVAA